MKKYILLFFIILAAFALPQVGLAANYFVGVTIASGQAPGSAGTNTNWCLPASSPIDVYYGTQFYIRNGTSNLTPVSPTANPIQLAGPACAGDTVWSGLFNLTSGTTYNAYFAISGWAYCPGVNSYWANNGSDYDLACWVSWDTPGQNKSCAEVCAHYGATQNYYTSNYPRQGQATGRNCVMPGRLMGGTCSSCTTNGQYDYYNPTTFACTTTTNNYNSNDAGGNATLGADVVRACPCNLSGSNSATFAFNFTPTF